MALLFLIAQVIKEVLLNNIKLIKEQYMQAKQIIFQFPAVRFYQMLKKVFDIIF